MSSIGAAAQDALTGKRRRAHRAPDFRGEILEELEKLRESDTVRVIDSLAVYKDAQHDLGDDGHGRSVVEKVGTIRSAPAE